MIKHTPAPWSPMAGMPTNVIGFGGYRVARCDFDGDTSNPETLANAMLVAAAPDMRDAIEAVIDPVGYCDKTGQDPHQPNWLTEKLHAALAKADGRSM